MNTGPQNSAQKLQPSLLDRLTDLAPTEIAESRDARVIAPAKLRQLVVRDLDWLFNTTAAKPNAELDLWPDIGRSVTSYGAPDLAGMLAAGMDLLGYETKVRDAIRNFEPRIDPQSLVVKVQGSTSKVGENGVTMTIDAQVWADPVPIELFLKTELDLDTGDVILIETR